MSKKSFAVLGLGKFGNTIVSELCKNGADVIAIDNDEQIVSEIAKICPTAFVADSTDEKALKELGVNEVDAAIVAFGNNKEASVLSTVILKELGIKQIICRVDDDYYGPILLKLGATEIITPQRAAGIALANRVGNKDFKDFYKLDDNYSIVSISINPSFVPKTIAELNPKGVFGVNIVLINRNGKSLVPGGTDEILPNDEVFVVGTINAIKSLREAINGKE